MGRKRRKRVPLVALRRLPGVGWEEVWKIATTDVVVRKQSNRVLSFRDRANCVLVSVNSHNRSEDGIKSITTLLSKPRSMHSAQPRPQIPEIWFQVLIIGRANAGKTSILQRICETTESPIVRKRTKGACHSEVCGQPFCLQV